MKKKTTLLKSLLVAAAMIAGVNGAWADETNLTPVGVFTWTNAPVITYNADATSWAINQGGVSGGKLGRYAGPYAIVKFDASSILAEKTLLSATLDFDITAGAYNSSINIALMDDASFDPATVTTETFDATAAQFQAGDWSTKNKTVHFSYDVKDKVEAANYVLAFAIYTNTGREQTLKDVVLKLNYASGPVEKYNYSLNAVASDESQIKVLASGEEYETNSVTAYFPYMFLNEGMLYSTTQTPYAVTFDKDNTSVNVKYEEADNIVAYMEGEAAMAGSSTNPDYSNGKAGYAEGNKTAVITTLAPGKYTATIRLAGNGNRSIVIRNTANSDVETNVIVSLPINKNSTAGLYTSDEFTITESTTVGFSGYTTGTKTNQSADIDYIYITKTGDIETVKATITSKCGLATFCSDKALDFSAVEGLTAYIVTSTEGVATLKKVTKVPAGTGLVLEGDVKTYEVPVIATADAIEGNLLIAATTDHNAVEGDYVLAYKSDVRGFFSAEEDLKIPAGKAYLHIGSGNAPAFLPFAGETTGIGATLVNSEVVNNEVYNLAGQRVAKPTKGLYIVGGRKVVVK